VIRCKEKLDGPKAEEAGAAGHALLAASIVDYKFIH
jgi:hypothetical protein